MNMPYKKLLKIFVTIILVGLVLSHVDLNEFLERLTNLSLWQVILALLCLVVQSLLVTKRWMLVLSRISTNVLYRVGLKIHYLGLSSSLVLPNVLAEPAIKGYLLKEHNVPISDAIASVIIDKIFVVFGLIVLSVLCGPFIFICYSDSRQWLIPYTAALIAAIVFAWII